jgi:hypothetical protein
VGGGEEKEPALLESGAVCTAGERRSASIEQETWCAAEYLRIITAYDDDDDDDDKRKKTNRKSKE